MMTWRILCAPLMLVVLPACASDLINATRACHSEDIPTKETQCVRFACPDVSQCPRCPDIPQCPKCPDVHCPNLPGYPNCPICPQFPDLLALLKYFKCPETQTPPCPEATYLPVTCTEVTPCSTTTATIGQNPTDPAMIGQNPTGYERCFNSSGTDRHPDNVGLLLMNRLNLVADGGWVTFQRRADGDVDFFRGWEEYKHGFGNMSDGGDFWLGNELIHQLTSSGTWELRVEVSFRGKDYYAEYTSFTVSGEEANYTLSVGGYVGTAGDSLAYHNDMPFTTKDRDNDRAPNTNCAVKFHGAWWYRNCQNSNLNGLWNARNFGQGVIWYLTTSSDYSATNTAMKMRPRL